MATPLLPDAAVPPALPDWLNPRPWLPLACGAAEAQVRRALSAPDPDETALAALLAPAAAPHLEAMAQRAQALTRRHFGRSIGLYAPLYLSDFCSGGCVYCGFAADRCQARRRLEPHEIRLEFDALRALGFEEVLLLTGERTPQADFPYLRDAVAEAARRFHVVTVEAFPMTVDEYRSLAVAGATGVTLYQETYDPARYAELHRWGPKRDYAARLEAPDRALAAGMRTVGLGALLGLNDPHFDLLALYRHARHLMRTHWQAGVALSFPRVCAQEGGWTPSHTVSERDLLQILLAFRIALPDVPLVLSTRERAAFRDGIAGLGVTRMSIESRTTVGGYARDARREVGQFSVNDNRDMVTFCAALRARGLEPVFKNGDAVYRDVA